MILTDNKVLEAHASQHITNDAEMSTPPAYDSLPSTLGSKTISAPKPANFVSISRSHESVRESIAIDPTLYIPPSLLPPLSKQETEETRKNLKLESIHGAIEAEVYVVPNVSLQSAEHKDKKVTMYMNATHGKVVAKVHRSATRPSFHLIAQSNFCNVHVYIPRSFHGPISASVNHGSVKFSDEVNLHLTTFGEENGTRRCFVGDYSTWEENDADGGWKGDQLMLSSKHGGVKIHYDNEDVPATSRRQSSDSWSRIKSRALNYLLPGSS